MAIASRQRFILASHICLVEFLLVTWSSKTNAIGERFVTQLCPGTVGPSYGEVLRFDPSSNSDSYVVPSTSLDCWITLRGRPTETGMPQYYTTLTWRSSSFLVQGFGYSSDPPDCTNAYVEVYQATNDGRPIHPPAVSSVCGTTPPASYTTTSQNIVVHLYVKAPPPTTTTSTTTTTRTTVTAATEATTTGATEAVVTADSATIDVETPTPEPDLVPSINFTADFTSYFVGSCASDGVANDRDQLQCYNGRCISMSLRCDRFFSDNCGDYGDVRASPPGNCSTTPTKEPTPFDMLPVWAALGALLTLLLTYWCCWRPGWFPWRVARLRNVACCRPVCSCCYRLSCCRNGCCGPTQGCFKKCCRTSYRTSSGYPESLVPASEEAVSRSSPVGNGWCFPKSRSRGGSPGDAGKSHAPNTAGSATAWMNFAFDDGAHVREMR
ncbi:hypothetical protein LSAT2_032458 [Lamellibrachia satsuma]|nr:hypothetical protein LSAT2_032458 [Lamellibrachia satsuma]